MANIGLRILIFEARREGIHLVQYISRFLYRKTETFLNQSIPILKSDPTWFTVKNKLLGWLIQEKVSKVKPAIINEIGLILFFSGKQVKFFYHLQTHLKSETFATQNDSPPTIFNLGR